MRLRSTSVRKTHEKLPQVNTSTGIIISKRADRIKEIRTNSNKSYENKTDKQHYFMITSGIISTDH